MGFLLKMVDENFCRIKEFWGPVESVLTCMLDVSISSSEIKFSRNQLTPKPKKENTNLNREKGLSEIIIFRQILTDLLELLIQKKPDLIGKLSRRDSELTATDISSQNSEVQTDKEIKETKVHLSKHLFSIPIYTHNIIITFNFLNTDLTVQFLILQIQKLLHQGRRPQISPGLQDPPPRTQQNDGATRRQLLRLRVGVPPLLRPLSPQIPPSQKPGRPTRHQRPLRHGQQHQKYVHAADQPDQSHSFHCAQPRNP